MARIKRVEVVWDVQTLKEFDDYPIEKLISIYDFILIDHPYMGEAATNTLLISIDTCVAKSFMTSQEKQSVGLSYNSYQYEGGMGFANRCSSSSSSLSERHYRSFRLGTPY